MSRTDFGFQLFSHGCRNDHSLSSEDDAVLYCEFISVVKVRGDAERDFAFLVGPSFDDGVHELR